MDKLLESKESMVQTINQIIQEYSYGVQLQDSRIQDIQSENKDLQKLVHKMASEIRSYLIVKPFPLMCRDGSYLGN